LARGAAADKRDRDLVVAPSHIGKLDPKTGAVTEYKIPEPRAKDPHTPVFDQKGILWFTVQNGNFVGRLDPKTLRDTLFS